MTAQCPALKVLELQVQLGRKKTSQQVNRMQKTKRVGRLGKGENCSTEGYLYMKIIVESTPCAPVTTCFKHLNQLE